MSNATLDAYIAQQFPSNAPPGLSNYAFYVGMNQAGPRPNGMPGINPRAIGLAEKYINSLVNNPTNLQQYYKDASVYYGTIIGDSAVSPSIKPEDVANANNSVNQLVQTASNVGVDPNTLVNTINSTANQVITNATSSSNDLISKVENVVSNPVTIAAIVAAPFTAGASLYVGEMALGATAAEAAATVAGVAAGTATATVGAATVGAALVNSAVSATLAAISGGDVTKSAISGAISGGAAANAGTIANTLTGGNVDAIAKTMNLTSAQVASGITNAVASGVVTAAVTGGDVKTAIASSLASSGVSAEVQNTINNNLPDMSGTAKVIGNVAGVATKAAVAGTDIPTAIQNSIGQIIGGQITQPTANTTTTTSQTDTGNTAVVVTTDPANNTALVMSTDGNVSVVSTTENIQSGSTVTVDPTTKVATTTNAAVTGTTFQPTASGGKVVSDVTPTTPLIKQPDSSVTIGGINVLPDTEQTGMPIFDANSPTGFSDANGKPINSDGTPYTSPTDIATEINPTVIARDSVNPSANTTQQIIDFISPTANVANVTITAGSGNQAGANASILANTGGTSNIGGVGTGDANVGIISTADNVGNIATSNVSNVTITAGGTNNANVTISDNVTNNAASTANVAPTGNALTSILSPSIIPSKASGTASGGFGPSSAYLGQALGTTSPDIGLTGGPPVLSGEEGQKRNVWNVESLRNALGI